MIKDFLPELLPALESGIAGGASAFVGALLFLGAFMLLMKAAAWFMDRM